jgi:hypothetical protein
MRNVVSLVMAAGCLLIAAISASAQPAPTVRITGVIENTDKDGIVVRPYEGGGTFHVFLSDDVAVFDLSKAALTDVKPGAFIGVGAMPQSDGSQRAMQIVIFAESQRGLGEGFRPWDRAPNGTMTNGTIDERVTSVDGPVLTVKYRNGEKKIVVPPDATILAYSVGDKSDLKVGAKVSIARAKKKLNGTLEADRVNVGRGDVVPR